MLLGHRAGNSRTRRRTCGSNHGIVRALGVRPRASVCAMARSANAIRLHDPKLEKLEGDALDQQPRTSSAKVILNRWNVVGQSAILVKRIEWACFPPRRRGRVMTGWYPNWHTAVAWLVVTAMASVIYFGSMTRVIDFGN